MNEIIILVIANENNESNENMKVIMNENDNK